MSSSPLLRIRPLVRRVALQAKHVHIDRDRAIEIARSWSAHAPAAAIGSEFERNAERVGFLMLLATTRFGSGYAAGLALHGHADVDALVASSLRRHIREHGVPAAPALQRMDAADCAELFSQRLAEAPQAEWAALQARALNELGRVLDADFAGQPENLIESAGASVDRLVETLARMPYFRDMQRYRGLELEFYGRAQRLAIDLSAAFENQGPGRFEDLGHVAPSSDDVALQGLRALGIVHLDAGLSEKIERGDLIPAHSEREIELRAVALLAVDLLTIEIRANGGVATPRTVDAEMRARAPSVSVPPKHRSRTVFY